MSLKKTAAGIQQAFSEGDYTAALQLGPTNTATRAAILRSPPITNSIGMKLRLLPPGTFMMGDANGDSDKTPHEVTLTQSFQMGIHEVTQEQYAKIMGNNPCRFTGANNHVETVSWDDAVEFCRKLSEFPAEKSAGRVYRLPTEAEWEYACRAGTTTAYIFGADDTELGDHAWFDGLRGNSKDKTHPVGGKKPNAWSLYDMHGNVWEWCQDRYGAYPGRVVTNPSGPNSGSYRVSRGGGWRGTAEGCRSAYRGRDKPSDRYFNIGFRVSLSPSGQ